MLQSGIPDPKTFIALPQLFLLGEARGRYTGVIATYERERRKKNILAKVRHRSVEKIGTMERQAGREREEGRREAFVRSGQIQDNED